MEVPQAKGLLVSREPSTGQVETKCKRKKKMHCLKCGDWGHVKKDYLGKEASANVATSCVTGMITTSKWKRGWPHLCKLQGCTIVGGLPRDVVERIAGLPDAVGLRPSQTCQAIIRETTKYHSSIEYMVVRA